MTVTKDAASEVMSKLGERSYPARLKKYGEKKLRKMQSEAGKKSWKKRKAKAAAAKAQKGQGVATKGFTRVLDDWLNLE